MNRLIVVLACLVAVFAPVFTNLVFCTGDNGHSAIEPAHGVTGCPDSTDPSTGYESGGAPCDDMPITAGDLVVRSVQAKAAEMERVLIPTILYSPLVAPAMGDLNHSILQPTVLDSPPAALRGAALGLRTTVLLI